MKKLTSCLPIVGGSLRGIPASSTTKTGRHGIVEILLKVALSTINQIKLLTLLLWKKTTTFYTVQLVNGNSQGLTILYS